MDSRTLQREITAVWSHGVKSVLAQKTCTGANKFEKQAEMHRHQQVMRSTCRWKLTTCINTEVNKETRRSMKD